MPNYTQNIFLKILDSSLSIRRNGTHQKKKERKKEIVDKSFWKSIFIQRLNRAGGEGDTL